MWQSSGVAGTDKKILAVGVKGARNVPIEDYKKMSWPDRVKVLASLRFLGAKQWTKTPAEFQKAREELDALAGRHLTDDEFMITQETYEGNKLLAQDILHYIDGAELVTPGILGPGSTPTPEVKAPGGPVDLADAQAAAVNAVPFVSAPPERERTWGYGTSLWAAANLVFENWRGRAPPDADEAALEKVTAPMDERGMALFDQAVQQADVRYIPYCAEGAHDGVKSHMPGKVVNPEGKGGTVHAINDVVEGSKLFVTNNGGRSLADGTLTRADAGAVVAQVNGEGVKALGNVPDIYAGQFFSRVPASHRDAIQGLVERLMDKHDAASVKELLEAVARANGIALKDLDVVLMKRDRDAALKAALQELGVSVTEISVGTVPHGLEAVLPLKTGAGLKHRILWATGGSAEALTNLAVAAAVEGGVGAVRLFTKTMGKTDDGKTAKSWAFGGRFTSDEVEELKSLRSDWQSIVKGEKIFRVADVRGPVEGVFSFLTDSGVFNMPGVQEVGRHVFRVHTLRIHKGQASIAVDDQHLPEPAQVKGLPAPVPLEEPDQMIVQRRSKLTKALQNAGPAYRHVADNFRQYSFGVTRQTDTRKTPVEIEVANPAEFEVEKGDVVHFAVSISGGSGAEPAADLAEAAPASEGPGLPELIKALGYDYGSGRWNPAPTALVEPLAKAHAQVDRAAAAALAPVRESKPSLRDIPEVPADVARRVSDLFPEATPLLGVFGVPPVLRGLPSQEQRVSEQSQGLKWFAFFAGIPLESGDRAFLDKAAVPFESADGLRSILQGFRAKAESQTQEVRVEAGLQFGAHVARLMEKAAAQGERGEIFPVAMQGLIATLLMDRERYSGEKSGELHEKAAVTLVEETSTASAPKPYRIGTEGRPFSAKVSGVPVVNVQEVSAELRDPTAFDNFVRVVVDSVSRDEVLFFTASAGLKDEQAEAYLRAAKDKAEQVLKERGGLGEDKPHGRVSLDHMASRLVTPAGHPQLLTSLGLYSVGAFYELLPGLYPQLGGSPFNVVFSDTGKDLERWDRSTLPASLRDRVAFLLIDLFRGEVRAVSSYTEKALEAIRILKYQA
jgi:hypothetical protein